MNAPIGDKPCDPSRVLVTDPALAALSMVGSVGGLARTRCRMMGHAGNWTYPDAGCAQVLVCKRCGDVTSRQAHTWSPFTYVAADRCDQERRCERCGATESDVVHAWGPWRYVGPDSFLKKLRQVHICRRCGLEEQQEFERAF